MSFPDATHFSYSRLILFLLLLLNKAHYIVSIHHSRYFLYIAIGIAIAFSKKC